MVLLALTVLNGEWQEKYLQRRWLLCGVVAEPTSDHLDSVSRTEV